MVHCIIILARASKSSAIKISINGEFDGKIDIARSGLLVCFLRVMESLDIAVIKLCNQLNDLSVFKKIINFLN